MNFKFLYVTFATCVYAAWVVRRISFNKQGYETYNEVELGREMFLEDLKGEREDSESRMIEEDRTRKMRKSLLRAEAIQRHHPTNTLPETSAFNVAQHLYCRLS